MNNAMKRLIWVCGGTLVLLTPFLAGCHPETPSEGYVEGAAPTHKGQSTFPTTPSAMSKKEAPTTATAPSGRANVPVGNLTL